MMMMMLMLQNPAPKWLAAPSWNDIQYMAETLPTFKDIVESFQKDHEVYEGHDHHQHHQHHHHYSIGLFDMIIINIIIVIIIIIQ